jgi:hypothetical protein
MKSVYRFGGMPAGELDAQLEATAGSVRSGFQR